MSSNQVNSKIALIADEVKNMFVAFLLSQESIAKAGKISLDKLVKNFESEEVQTELVDLITKLIPKEKVVKVVKEEKEKKLKDPNAPKRPKSSYLFFCDVKRTEIKEEYPDLKATQITSKIGEMWRALSDSDKKTYELKAQTAKEEYKIAMESYVRPSDEELEGLATNKRRRKSRSDSDSDSKKKDPNAPKRPVTAYLFFCKDKRAEVKEANPDMKPAQITSELGRMWREEYADDTNRKKWVKLAEQDKKRFDNENKDYKSGSEDEKETSPKTAPRRVVKRSKSDESDDEKPKTRRSKRTVKKSDESDDEKPKTRRSKRTVKKSDESDQE